MTEELEKPLTLDEVLQMDPAYREALSVLLLQRVMFGIQDILQQILIPPRGDQG